MQKTMQTHAAVFRTGPCPSRTRTPARPTSSTGELLTPHWTRRSASGCRQPSDLTRIFIDKHFSDLTRVLLCITYLYQNTVDTIHLMSLKIKEILYTVHF